MSEPTSTFEVVEVADDGHLKAAPPANRRIVDLASILVADDTELEWVAIPEWAPAGAADPSAYGVFAKSLDGRERSQWQQSALQGQGKNQSVNFLASTVKLVTLGAVDEDRARVFSDDDGRKLARKSSAVLNRIAEVVMKLSGIGDEEVEAVAGNSPDNLNDDSP